MYKVIKRTQHFKLKVPDLDTVIYKLYAFHQTLTTYTKIFIKRGKRKETKRKVDKKYYVIDERDNSIRYPISLIDKFIGFMSNYFTDDVDIINELPPEGDDIEFEMTHGFELRDYQIEAIEGILKSKNVYLVDLPTGSGKSIIGLEAARHIGKRFGFIILPTYIDKWIKDIKRYTDITDEEIYVVQGGDSLRTLLMMDDLSGIKVILFSMSTLRNYLKEWLNADEEFTYPVEPDKLIEKTGLGLLISDESHQEFHNLYTIMCFLNVKKFVGMTATLEHKDATINDMYKVLFPEDQRASNGRRYEKYITVVSVKYYLRNRKVIEYKTNYGYSQSTFEKSILLHSDVLDRYLSMIAKMVKAMYIDRKDRKDGDKMLIFAGTIKMCEAIRDKLRKEFKDLNLKIDKYNAEDDFSVLMESDIIVSTIQSAGTAVDIPNLIAVLQTVATESVQANKQSIGRLRNIKREVVFAYIWCGDIHSHYKYNKARLKYFEDKAKEIRLITFKVPI